MPVVAKSFFYNLLSFFIGVLYLSFSHGEVNINNLILIACIIWLCNEVWYWIFSTLSVILVFVGFCKRKDISSKIYGVLYRITSFSLVILPLLIFAIIRCVDYFFPGKQEELLGIVYSNQLVISVYFSMLALWIFTFFTKIQPLAVEVIYEYYCEPALDEMPEQKTTKEYVDGGCEYESACSSIGLNAESEQIIYREKAVLNVQDKRIRRDFCIGVVVMFPVVLFVLIAVHTLQFSYLLAGVSFAISLIFFFVSFSLLRTPSRWKDKLKNVEYIVTSKTLHIIEGEHCQSFAIDHTLNIAHESITEDIGNIYVAKSGKVANIARKIFRTGNIVTLNKSDHISLSEPLPGFYQVKHSKEIFKRLTELKESNSRAMGQ